MNTQRKSEYQKGYEAYGQVGVPITSPAMWAGWLKAAREDAEVREREFAEERDRRALMGGYW